jgi:hypothetical protein
MTNERMRGDDRVQGFVSLGFSQCGLMFTNERMRGDDQERCIECGIVSLREKGNLLATHLAFRVFPPFKSTNFQSTNSTVQRPSWPYLYLRLSEAQRNMNKYRVQNITLMSFRIGVDCIFSLRCHRTQPHGTQELGAEGRATKSRSPCVCFSATGIEVVCKRQRQGCRLVKVTRHSHSLQRFARVRASCYRSAASSPLETGHAVMTLL